MPKRAVIVHGWEGHPEEGWFPWLRKGLESRGYHVLVPQMPDPDKPEFQAWLEELKRTVSKPDADTFLIGHSLGCITILRYLEGLEDGQRIGGAVLVAGFTDNLGYKEIDSFFRTPVDFEAIKKHCRKFAAIHSDNDPYVPLKHGHIFRDRLGAKLIVEKGQKHFSGSEGKTELTVAMEALLGF